MPEFVLINGARGIDLDGGGSVQADHRGRIKVSDEVAERIRGSSALKRYDAILEIRPGRGFGRVSDRIHCGRTMWAWESTCPKCGAPVPAEEGSSLG